MVESAQRVHGSMVGLPNEVQDKDKDIQKVPGYQGWFDDLNEVTKRLDRKDPFTYAIVQLNGERNDDFWLSYLSENSVIQSVKCAKGIKEDQEQFIFANGFYNIEPTLESLIKKVMHWDDSKPDPKPLSYY